MLAHCFWQIDWFDGRSLDFFILIMIRLCDHLFIDATTEWLLNIEIILIFLIDFFN